ARAYLLPRSLHDALPISAQSIGRPEEPGRVAQSIFNGFLPGNDIAIDKPARFKAVVGVAVSMVAHFVAAPEHFAGNCGQPPDVRSEEHTSELPRRENLEC